MHSVTESATSALAAPRPGGPHGADQPVDLRTSKREETMRRIVTAARRLTVERGLDGFTMDDLAHEVGVSRRTLFNYVPGKDDAVLGPTPTVGPETFETFVAGGPHGSLVPDLAEVVVLILGQRPESPAEVALAREAMHANPRLISVALHNLQEMVESCQEIVQQREGTAYDRERFDVALAVVVSCLHLSMDRFLTGEHGTDLAPLFLRTLGVARDLLA